MSSIYQVQRPEPLPVDSNIELEILEDLEKMEDELFDEDMEEIGGHRDHEPDDCDIVYLRGITANIMGRDTASSRWIAIGHMKAVYVRENFAVHKTITHGKPKELLDQKKDKHSASLRTLNETIKEQEIDDTILGFGRGWGDILLIENIHLEKRYRGYGISLRAVDLFVD